MQHELEELQPQLLKMAVVVGFHRDAAEDGQGERGDDAVY